MVSRPECKRCVVPGVVFVGVISGRGWAAVDGQAREGVPRTLGGGQRGRRWAGERHWDMAGARTRGWAADARPPT